MLSLGTGECITNTLKSGKNYNILFWGRKASEIIEGQQNIVDEELSEIMGNNYHRWQYWLENPIALDDVSDSNIAVLINAGQALVEDLKADDEGSWNNLVEHLKYS